MFYLRAFFLFVEIFFLQPICAPSSFLPMSVCVWWDLATPLALGFTHFSLSSTLLKAPNPNLFRSCIITGLREECAQSPSNYGFPRSLLNLDSERKIGHLVFSLSACSILLWRVSSSRNVPVVPKVPLGSVVILQSSWALEHIMSFI